MNNPQQYFSNHNLFDIMSLRALCAHNHVDIQTSSRFPNLVLLHYDREVETENAWNPFNRMSRGLIVDLKNKLVELKQARDSVALSSEEFKKLSSEIQNTRTEILKAEGRINEFGKRTANTTQEQIEAFFKVGAAVTAAFGIAKLVTFGKTQKEVAAAEEKAQKIEYYRYLKECLINSKNTAKNII